VFQIRSFCAVRDNSYSIDRINVTVSHLHDSTCIVYVVSLNNRDVVYDMNTVLERPSPVGIEGVSPTITSSLIVALGWESVRIHRLLIPLKVVELGSVQWQLRYC